jgi:ATP-dependent protease HslVU (ClpYQ) peptidase subunit
MTTVVAIARDGRVVMGADEMTNVYDRPVPGAAKIWRIEPKTAGAALLIGIAGAAATGPIIGSGLVIDAVPDPAAADSAFDDWANTVARAISELVVEAGVHDGGKLDGVLLLAHAGRLWTICHAFAIRHHDGIAAVGSGEGPAIGAVDAAVELGERDLHAIVERAVRIGINRDRYSGGTPQVLEIA